MKFCFLLSAFLIHSLAYSQATTHFKPTSEPYFPIYNKKLKGWEYVTIDGVPVMQVTLKNLDSASYFVGNRAAVHDKKTKLWGFIDKTGNWAIPPKYFKVEHFYRDYAIVRTPCMDCYLGEEGVSYPYDSQLIDTNGKVVFSDQAQLADPAQRWYLDKYVGSKIVRTQSLIAEECAGQELLDFDRRSMCVEVTTCGGIMDVYPEAGIFQCDRSFYTMSGELKGDLNRWNYVGHLSEGTVWVCERSGPQYNDQVIYKVLVNLGGDTLGVFDSKTYFNPRDVVNGRFFYYANEGLMSYDLKTKQSSRAPELTIFTEVEALEAGEILPNHTRFIYFYGEVVGFVSPREEWYYSRPMNLEPNFYRH